MKYKRKGTIAAIATATGEAAISKIRISGKNALPIINRIFSKNLKNAKTHTLHFGKILDKKNSTIDTVLVSVMLEPRSFTGENTIEIDCHGGRLITEKVLTRVLEAGAIPALPGEFSFRAFINKKIDLTRAEAIQKIISSKNELSLKSATLNLEGTLFKKIKSFQKTLIDIASNIEAGIDFSEEDLDLVPVKTIEKDLKTLIKDIQKLEKTFSDGKVIDGTRVAIVGTPNVGKSSLMNVLCRQKRSIVTNTPGTTRDMITEKVSIGPNHFELIDTAGIRKNPKKIEKEGIKSSKKALLSDLVLLLLDASKNLEDKDLELLKKTSSKNTIVIWNKIDLKKDRALPKNIKHKKPLYISAKKEIGIEELKKEIERMLFRKTLSASEIIITQKRHFLALLEAKNHCKKALFNIQRETFELAACDIRWSLKSLNEIIGHEITEDILSSIFSKFCIGK